MSVYSSGDVTTSAAQYKPRKPHYPLSALLSDCGPELQSLAHGRKSAKFTSSLSQHGAISLFLCSNDDGIYEACQRLQFQRPTNQDTYAGIGGITNLFFACRRPISRIVMFDPNESMAFFWKIVGEVFKENNDPEVARRVLIDRVKFSFPLDEFSLTELTLATFIEALHSPESCFSDATHYGKVREIILKDELHVICVDLQNLEDVELFGTALRRMNAKIDTLNLTNAQDSSWVGLKRFRQAVQTLCESSHSAPILLTTPTRSTCEFKTCALPSTLLLVETDRYAPPTIPLSSHKNELDHVVDLVRIVQKAFQQLILVNTTLERKRQLPNLFKAIETRVSYLKKHKSLFPQSCMRELLSILEAFKFYVSEYGSRSTRVPSPSEFSKSDAQLLDIALATRLHDKYATYRSLTPPSKPFSEYVISVWTHFAMIFLASQKVSDCGKSTHHKKLRTGPFEPKGEMHSDFLPDTVTPFNFGNQHQ